MSTVDASVLYSVQQRIVFCILWCIVQSSSFVLKQLVNGSADSHTVAGHQHHCNCWNVWRRL